MTSALIFNVSTSLSVRQSDTLESTLVAVALTVEVIILQIMLRCQRATMYYEFSYFSTLSSTLPMDGHG